MNYVPEFLLFVGDITTNVFSDINNSMIDRNSSAGSLKLHVCVTEKPDHCLSSVTIAVFSSWPWGQRWGLSLKGALLQRAVSWLDSGVMHQGWLCWQANSKSVGRLDPLSRKQASLPTLMSLFTCLELDSRLLLMLLPVWILTMASGGRGQCRYHRAQPSSHCRRRAGSHRSS